MEPDLGRPGNLDGTSAPFIFVCYSRFNGAGPGKARKFKCVRFLALEVDSRAGPFNGAGPGKARKSQRTGIYLPSNCSMNDALQWSRTWEGPEIRAFTGELQKGFVASMVSGPSQVRLH